MKTPDYAVQPEYSVSYDTLTHALEIAGCLSIRLGGGSMFPVIRNNDIVVVKKCDSNTIRQGDIVFFGVEKIRLVAHRVITIKKKGDQKVFITKGDMVLGFDQAISPEMVIGKIMAVSRNNELVTFDKVLWCRLIRAFQVSAPHVAIVLSYMLLTVKRATDNMFSRKKK